MPTEDFSKTKNDMQKESMDKNTQLAIEYFYSEQVNAMIKAGYSTEEIKKSSYIKHLKQFLALDTGIVNKYQTETHDPTAQKRARAARVAHEKEVYASDPKHKEEAIAYFVKEQIDAMKKAGFSDAEIAKSSYIKNLPTFLKMDEGLVAKYVEEKTNPNAQRKARGERLAHEKEVFAAQDRPTKNRDMASLDKERN